LRGEGRKKNVVERDEETTAARMHFGIEKTRPAFHIVSLHYVGFRPRSEAFELFLSSRTADAVMDCRNRMHCIETSVGNRPEALEAKHTQASWLAPDRESEEAAESRVERRLGRRPCFSTLLLGRPALPLRRNVRRSAFTVVVVCRVTASDGDVRAARTESGKGEKNSQVEV
jgi:hypothetical protein